jgi:hypothetical protein
MDAHRLAPDPDTDPATTHEYACPFCELTCATHDAVYRHLQVNHRKSRLCRALVERVDLRIESATESTSDA